MVRHQEACLIYDRPIGDGALTRSQLIAWSSGRDDLDEATAAEQGRLLYRRLMESMAGNEAEQLVMRTYASLYARLGFDIPALLPQVYVHYDPLGRRRDGGRPALTRQRMDFLILLPHHRRVVVEVDGRPHYADNTGRADPGRSSGTTEPRSRPAADTPGQRRRYRPGSGHRPGSIGAERVTKGKGPRRD